MSTPALFYIFWAPRQPPCVLKRWLACPGLPSRLTSAEVCDSAVGLLASLLWLLDRANWSWGSIMCFLLPKLIRLASVTNTLCKVSSIALSGLWSRALVAIVTGIDPFLLTLDTAGIAVSPREFITALCWAKYLFRSSPLVFLPALEAASRPSYDKPSVGEV